MSEAIIRRRGEATERKESNESISMIAALKTEYADWKLKLRRRESDYEHEKEKQSKISESLLNAQEDLALIDEEIDCDPLPIGAQPRERITRREKVHLVHFYFPSGFETIENIVPLVYFYLLACKSS